MVLFSHICSFCQKYLTSEKPTRFWEECLSQTGPSKNCTIQRTIERGAQHKTDSYCKFRKTKEHTSSQVPCKSHKKKALAQRLIKRNQNCYE